MSSCFFDALALLELRVGRLRSYIAHLSVGYDLVLMDLPPSVSNLNKLFMVSSDYIMMPVKPDNFSGDTLWQLFKGEKGKSKGTREKSDSRCFAYTIGGCDRGKHCRFRHDTITDLDIRLRGIRILDAKQQGA